MSCEAFDIYLSGIEKAFELYMSLIKPSSTASFAQFLLDSQEDIDMDLKTFLLLPLYYVGDIYLCLKTIRDGLSPRHSDYICLNSLANGLEAYVKRSKSILNKYSKLTVPTTTSSSDNQNTAAANNANNLIYSSKLQYRQSGHKWKRVQAVLTSQAISIASRHLNIQQEHQQPFESSSSMKTIPLNSIKKIDFNLANQLEFQFNYVKTSSSTGSNSNILHAVRLKTASLEEKNAWRKLLNRQMLNSVGGDQQRT
jgi:hypothetical protein